MRQRLNLAVAGHSRPGVLNEQVRFWMFFCERLTWHEAIGRKRLRPSTSSLRDLDLEGLVGLKSEWGFEVEGYSVLFEGGVIGYGGAVDGDPAGGSG